MRPHGKLPRAARAYLLAGKRRSQLQIMADRRYRVLSASPTRYGGDALKKWLDLTDAADRARVVTRRRFAKLTDNPNASMETPT